MELTKKQAKYLLDVLNDVKEFYWNAPFLGEDDPTENEEILGEIITIVEDVVNN